MESITHEITNVDIEDYISNKNDNRLLKIERTICEALPVERPKVKKLMTKVVTQRWQNLTVVFLKNESRNKIQGAFITLYNNPR